MLLRVLPKLFRCHRSYIAAAIDPTALNVKQFTLEQTHIAEAIKVKPSLSSTPIELWQRTHNTFANHGIDTSSFLQIITSNPSLLTKPPAKIIESMEIWRSLQFGEKLLHLLLTKYPEMLDLPNVVIRRQFSHLHVYVGTNKNVWKVLMSCPDLMQQSETTIRQKFEYLTQIMRIEIPEIVKSEALSRSLVEIQCRHVFLERLGLFTPRPLKADVNQPTKNHRLYKITDTSEKTFATKVCHVSLLEFESFKELYAKELERKRRTAEEDDFDNSIDESDDE